MGKTGTGDPGVGDEKGSGTKGSTFRPYLARSWFLLVMGWEEESKAACFSHLSDQKDSGAY